MHEKIGLYHNINKNEVRTLFLYINRSIQNGQVDYYYCIEDDERRNQNIFHKQ